MTLYELVFIFLFLGSVISLLLSAVLRKRNILVALASVWGVYLVILGVTDVFISRKVFKVGEEQCFDEMCFAVVSCNSSVAQASTRYIVQVRATSHSRGRAQAEGGLRGRLYDGNRYIDVSEAAQHGDSPKLSQKIAPGESILCVLVFEVPRAIASPALVLDHGFTPGYFVIGESPFFHEPDIHELRINQAANAPARL